MFRLEIWFNWSFVLNFVNTPNTTVFQVSAMLFCWTIANFSFVETIVIANLYVVRYAFFFFLRSIQEFSNTRHLEGVKHFLLLLYKSVSDLLFSCTIVLTLNARQLPNTFLFALKIEASALTSSYILRCRSQLFRRNG